MSAGKRRCYCGGELALVGEARDQHGWRTAFKLRCGNCGKNWTYSGGVYREDADKNEVQG